MWILRHTGPRSFLVLLSFMPLNLRDICFVLGTVMPLGTKRWPQILSWRASKQEGSQSVTGRRVWEWPRRERENLSKGRGWLGKACSLGNWCTIWEKRKSHMWQMCVYKCEFCTQVTLLFLHVCKCQYGWLIHICMSEWMSECIFMCLYIWVPDYVCVYMCMLCLYICAL